MTTKGEVLTSLIQNATIEELEEGKVLLTVYIATNQSHVMRLDWEDWLQQIKIELEKRKGEENE